MRLRAGTLADVPAMHRLDCLCFEEVFRFDLRFMRRLVLQRNAIVVVAESDEGIVGFVIYEVNHRAEFSSAYVTTLDVHPEYRRLGIAKALMDEADRRALVAGVNHIRLHVFAANEAAIHLYESRRYNRILVSENFYGQGLDAILYLKRISNLPPGKLSKGSV